MSIQKRLLHRFESSDLKEVSNRIVEARKKGRLKKLTEGGLNPDDFMISGSRSFLEELNKRGVVTYLASGTDHAYVLREAGVLGITGYFKGGVYGALDHTDMNSKEKIIEKILNENNLRGTELLMVGDGPVEIRSAKSRGAIALGVASDEVNRVGLNPRKRKRLINAGADLIVPDFTRTRDLVALLGL